MKQGTIIVYWGPVGAMVYFYVTDNAEGQHVFCKLGPDDCARIDTYNAEHEIL